MRTRVQVLIWLSAMAALPALIHAQMPGQQSPTAKSTASAPADPHDMAGMWEFFQGLPGQGIYATPSKDHPPMTPWAQAKYDAAKPGYGPKAQAGGNDPILKCNPAGIPRILFFPQPFEIFQAPDRVFMFFEREHEWRQIWTDGRSHPKDVAATWMGDSIGKWEGDTLVVDTVGFNDKTWLDNDGHPHTEDLRVVERIRRVNHDTLTIDTTIEDPKAYTKSWGGHATYELKPDWNIGEMVCEDNITYDDMQKKSEGSK